MDAVVTGLFLARRRKEPRESVELVDLIADHGVSGDAYAGPGDRQLVLFEDGAREEIEAASEQGLCYARFYENIRVVGLGLATLAVGDRLQLSEAVAEITSTAKRCYPECTLAPGECRIRGHVAFARVVSGGRVAVGAHVTRHTG
jgi:MOSC domain-containing protein YiiM